uniref:Similar to n=1 Tax=Panagrellus redivivus TaxID=6233 RepID=A0A7E4W244_PANRE
MKREKAVKAHEAKMRQKKKERPTATSSTASTSAASTSTSPQKAVLVNQNAYVSHTTPASAPSVPTRAPVPKQSRPIPASSSSSSTRRTIPKPSLPTPGHVPVASIAVPTTVASQPILYATPVANPALPPSTSSDPSSSMYIAREPSNNTTYYISTVNLAEDNKKLTEELTSCKLKMYNLIKTHNELRREHERCHRPLVRVRHSILSHAGRQQAGKRIMDRLKEMCPIYEEDDWCEALIKLFPKLRTYVPTVVAPKPKKKRVRPAVPVTDSNGEAGEVVILEASGEAGLADHTVANADSNGGTVQVGQDLIREDYPDEEIWILD